MEMVRLKLNNSSCCRCVGDHHRDGQFPFLDENVVSFLQELPITSKVRQGKVRIV